MKNRKTVWRAVMAAGVAAAVVVSLSPPVAFAETTQPTIIGPRPASDPHVEGCFEIDADGHQHDYWCMFASNDLNQAPDPYFAMGSTYVYTFDPSSGKNPGDPASWVDRGRQGSTNLIVPAFDQSQLPMACKAGHATCNGNELNHLWAPTATYVPAEKRTLLYVPDIYGDSLTIPGISGDNQVSYIAVAESTTKPWGPFTYKKNVTWGGAQITDSYMSDPALSTIGWSHPIIDENWRDSKTNRYPCKENWVNCHFSRDAATWLLWANGDNMNGSSKGCGGISIGWLRDGDLTDLVDNPNRQFSEVTINGIGAALGTCTDMDHPYEEGPELYDLTQVNVPLPHNPVTGESEPLALFMAVKPNGGTHGASNQVLAWASASNPRGPYTYRGILMEASNSSWTNHGNIIASTITVNDQSEPRFIMFYHDEPDRGSQDAYHRKARAVCLKYSRNAANPGFLTASPYETNPPGGFPDLKACTSMVP
jgi:hypothetical protein